MSEDINWKKKLSKEEYKIIREKGTEKPGTSKFLDFNKKGEYVCVACGNVLFDSNTKFHSGTGWPSFWDAKHGSVNLVKDDSLGMERSEVICSKCKGHLGHVFLDGPVEHGGKRFCINGIVLNFKKM
jgi:peptide-methionine (R)-S-oxide reductase